MNNSHTSSRGSRGSRVETFWSLLLSLVFPRASAPPEDGHPPREPREPRELRSPGIPPAAAYWTRLLPAVATGWPVCVEAGTFHHHGQLTAVRIGPGGSARVRFADGVEVTLPGDRTVRT